MKKLLAVMLCLFAGSSGLVFAESSDEQIKQNLHKVDPRIKVTSISEAPVEGMREVVLNSGEVLYSDSKGEYFIIGQLYRYSNDTGFVNLTEEKAKAQRQEKIAIVAKEDMVVFAPEGEVKARVYVFTDISCPYCVKLHREIESLNELGIEVSYLAFPRAGRGSTAHKQMNAIWCAGDDEMMRKAMTNAKLNGGIEGSDCETPVIEQMKLGQSIGVTGTPALILEDGTLVPGYLPATHLAKRLGIN